MTKTKTKQADISVSSEQLRKLWCLNDDQLFRRIKADLVANAALTLWQPSKTAFAATLVSNAGRMAFQFKFLGSTQEQAPSVVLGYLKNFQDRLYEEICVRLQYCRNKKKFSDFFKKHLKKIVADPDNWKTFYNWLVTIHVSLALALKWFIPASLLVYLVKVALDKLCGCKT